MEEGDSLFWFVKESLNQFEPNLPGSGLYKNIYVVIMTFRVLPSLVQNVLLRIGSRIPFRTVHSMQYIGSFFKEEGMAERFCDILKDLKIISILQAESCVKFDENFLKNLCNFLLNGDNVFEDNVLSFESIESSEKYKKELKDEAFLNSYSIECWENILCFLAGTKKQNQGHLPSSNIIKVLMIGDFIKLNDSGATHQEILEHLEKGLGITSNGFKFLLLSRDLQIRRYLMYHLKLLREESSEVYYKFVSFLGFLSISEPNKPYLLTTLYTELNAEMRHLRELGMVYQRNSRSNVFYVTRLTKEAFSMISSPTNDVKNTGWQEGVSILVESNFRLYAYGASPLYIAVLSLFCEIMVQFPGMTVARISRESVRDAMSHGIFAEDIIKFLQSHLSIPNKSSGNNASTLLNRKFLMDSSSQELMLPENVVTHLKLWNMERNRMRRMDAILYSEFKSDADFSELLRFAISNHCMIWNSPERRILLIKPTSHDKIKEYWKSRKFF